MPRSLYEEFGEPVRDADPKPGTLYTFAVETVDNDHASMEFTFLSGEGPRPEPNPGTHFTEAVETVDDDHAAVQLGILQMAGLDPRPRPGTTLTATIETTDEDAATTLRLFI